MEAFPAWKNTFSSLPRQWRLLSGPRYEKRTVRKQADSPFEIFNSDLVALLAGVLVVALEAEFRREFAQAAVGIVFLKAAHAATSLIRRLVRAFVSGSPEGDKFIDSVALSLIHI